MHSIRITAVSLVIISLAAAPLLAQGTTSTRATDGKKTTPPTVNTGGTIPTASEGSTAIAIRGRPATTRGINIETGSFTAQAVGLPWTVELRAADRGLLGRLKPGDAVTLDLVAGRGSVGGQSCPIVNVTSEIRFPGRYLAEQLCAKSQADLDAQTSAAIAAGNSAVTWGCSVKEKPGSSPPSYFCLCVPTGYSM